MFVSFTMFIFLLSGTTFYDTHGSVRQNPIISNLAFIKNEFNTPSLNFYDPRTPFQAKRSGTQLSAIF